MNLTTCPECGKEQNATFKFCENCGAKLDKKNQPTDNDNAITENTTQNIKKCPNCGSEVDNEKFCKNCGQKLDVEYQKADTKIETQEDTEIETQVDSKIETQVDSKIETQEENPQANSQKTNKNSNTQNTNNTGNIPTKYCEHCGKKIPKTSKICPECGKQSDYYTNNDSTNNNNSTNNDSDPIVKYEGHKNPTISTILSIIFPGLGHLYNGLISKGLIFIIIAFTALLIFGLLFYIIILLIATFDARRTAKKMNRGELIEDYLYMKLKGN